MQASCCRYEGGVGVLCKGVEVVEWWRWWTEPPGATSDVPVAIMILVVSISVTLLGDVSNPCTALYCCTCCYCCCYRCE
jgi:hypothetical protein